MESWVFRGGSVAAAVRRPSIGKVKNEFTSSEMRDVIYVLTTYLEKGVGLRFKYCTPYLVSTIHFVLLLFK